MSSYALQDVVVSNYRFLCAACTSLIESKSCIIKSANFVSTFLVLCSFASISFMHHFIITALAVSMEETCTFAVYT